MKVLWISDAYLRLKYIYFQLTLDNYVYVSFNAIFPFFEICSHILNGNNRHFRHEIMSLH